MVNNYLHSVHLILGLECEWSTWTTDKCSQTCGGGFRMKSREKIKKEIGTVCEAKQSISEKCNEEECPGIYITSLKR